MADQQNHDASRGQAANDLSLDYLASAFASNGVIPSMMMMTTTTTQAMPSTPTAAAVSNAARNHSDLINAFLLAATGTANNSGAASASHFLSSMMYNQQKQQQQTQELQRDLLGIPASAQRHANSPKSTPSSSFGPTNQLYAQDALLQAGLTNLDPAFFQQQQHHLQQQQQQLALSLASLLGQPSAPQAMAPAHQHNDYGTYKMELASAYNSAGSTGAEESFSAVLAKLTRGLNQGHSSSVNASSSASGEKPHDEEEPQPSIPPSPPKPTHSSAASSSSSFTDPMLVYQLAAAAGLVDSTLHYPLMYAHSQNSDMNTDTFSATLAALEKRYSTQLLQQNQQAVASQQKTSQQKTLRRLHTEVKAQGGPTTSMMVQNREARSHRGRGRPPKSGVTPLKSTSIAPPSDPLTEVQAANSTNILTYSTANSIDGTITDVLKRLSDSVNEHSYGGTTERNKKLRRLAADSCAFSTADGTSAAAAKLETLGQKRNRSSCQTTDAGYRLPLAIGWRRETLVKGVGPGGILGEVVYITPSGLQLWTIENVREYLRSLGSNILTTEDFTFRSSILLGDYYECNKDLQGFVKMSDAAVDALINTEQQQQQRQESALSSSPSYTHLGLTSPPSPGSGPLCTPNLLATSVASSSTDCLGDFQMGFPRFPHPPQQPPSASLTNPVGAVWSPWSTAEVQVAPSASATLPDLAFATTLNNEQQGENGYQIFERLKNFFTKLVVDQCEQETKKESIQKAKLEAQTTQLRDQRIEQLVEEELQRPTEDLHLLNPKPLPSFNRIKGNRMPSQVFSDSLLVIEFLHAFTEVLCIDPETIPSFGCLQAAFVDKDETCLAAVSHLIIELLKFAILDPGIPSPRLVTQLLGQRFSEMEVNYMTVTGLLRVFLIGRNGYENEMSDWLAPGNVDQLVDLPGPRLACLLAFICDELACSSRLISNEVDRTIELQASMRRDKFNLEARIRKIHVLLARKFGVDHTEKPAAQSSSPARSPAFLCSINSCGATYPNHDSGDEEELSSAKDLKERIELLNSALEAKQHAIEASAFRLSGVFLGQDRFHRQYFVLGSVGGIFVEGKPVANEEGHAVNDPMLSLCDPDVIVAEICARRDIAAARQFKSLPAPNAPTPSNTKSHSAVTLNEKSIYSNKHTDDDEDNDSDKANQEEEDDDDDEEEEEEVSVGFIKEDTDDVGDMAFYVINEVKKEEGEIEKEQKDTENCDNDKNEVAVMKSNGEAGVSVVEIPDEEPIVQGMEEVEKEEEKEEEEPPVEETQNSDGNQEEEKDGSLVTKIEETVEEMAPKEATAEVEEENENTVSPEQPVNSSQPLDLSTRRPQPSSPAPVSSLSSNQPTPSDPEAGDLAVWEALTEQDLSATLEACQMDDTFLTSATLLFTTQMGYIDKSAITSGVWSDPSWPVILLFYKLQLLRCLAFEMKTARSGEPTCLSSALQHLKKLLAKSTDPGAVDMMALSDGIDMDQEALLADVGRILKERSIQDNSSMANILEDVVGDWWRVDTPQKLEALLNSLSPRGIRERSLSQAIQLSEEAVLSSVSADASSVLDASTVTEALASGWKPPLLRVRSRRGKGRGASTPGISSAASTSCLSGGGRLSAIHPLPPSTNILPGEIGDGFDAYTFRGDFDASNISCAAVVDKTIFLGENFGRAMAFGRAANSNLGDADREFQDECRFLELVEGLVDRVLSASLQSKGWQPPMKVNDDDTVRIIPRASPKISRYDHWPLDLARERLLDLEAHVERRYLLTPLSCESRLDVIHADDSGASDSAHDDSDVSGVPHIRVVQQQRRSKTDGSGADEDGGVSAKTLGLSGGLLQWRKQTRNAENIAELKRCAMQFEAAIAWDKSIMKVLCQICRRDKNEARLLLCDGCDHGYHTYCFRPPLVSIPEGDWFCFDCVSKATGRCHCFVCGLARHITPPSSASAAAATTAAVTSAVVEPRHHLVKCVTCSRGAHMSCLRPPMARLPRRWNCMFCIANGASVTSEKASANASSLKSQKSHRRDRSKVTHPKRLYGKAGISRVASAKSPAQRPPKASTEQRKLGRPKSRTNRARKRSQRGRPPGCGAAKRPRDASAPASIAEEAEESGQETREGAEDQHEEEGEEEVMEDDWDSRGEHAGRGVINGVVCRRKAIVTLHGRPTNPPSKPMCFSEREFCRRATEDLIKHDLSWPFRKPVCCKSVPFYRKIIKRPMDLSTILKRIDVDRWNSYVSLSEWREDVRLIFNNCQIFNEDDSDIGKAGYELSAYFDSHWSAAPEAVTSDPGEPNEEPVEAVQETASESSSSRPDDHQQLLADIDITEPTSVPEEESTILEDAGGRASSPDSNQPAEASLIGSPVA